MTPRISITKAYNTNIGSKNEEITGLSIKSEVTKSISANEALSKTSMITMTMAIIKRLKK